MSNKVAPSPLYDLLQQLKAEINSGLRVCLPGSISGVDPSTGTVSVKIGIMQKVSQTGFAQGLSISYPELSMCPLFSLQGGGAGVVMPVKVGDECLVLFSDRCIDSWFSSGQPAPLPSSRMHDLSDGLVIVGFNTMVNPLNTPLSPGEGGLCETRNGFGVKVAISPLLHKATVQNATQNLFLTLTTLFSVLAADPGLNGTSHAALAAANVSLAELLY